MLHLEHPHVTLGLVPPKILLSLVWSGGRGRGERDRIAEVLEATDVVALEPLVVELLEVVRSQVLGGLMGAQHMIDADQEAVSDRHNGA